MKHQFINQVRLAESDQKDIIQNRLFELLESLDDFRINHLERIRIFNSLIEVMDDGIDVEIKLKESAEEIKD